MREFVVTAVGADRPGIVAALAEDLLRVGGNLEDARAAILRGSFAVALAVAVPDDVGAADVTDALAGTADRLGLGVSVVPGREGDAHAAGRHCVVSVYGADRPGIVASVARVLADASANIEDLSARLVGDPPVYVLGVEVCLPDGVDPDDLGAALRERAGGEGIEVAVEESDAL